MKVVRYPVPDGAVEIEVRYTPRQGLTLLFVGAAEGEVNPITHHVEQEPEPGCLGVFWNEGYEECAFVGVFVGMERVDHGRTLLYRSNCGLTDHALRFRDDVQLGSVLNHHRP